MIKLFTTRKDFDHYRKSVEGKTVGLVPTMGNLHQGHISLLEKSVSENDVSIMTIFVNPKQFGPNEDFDKYPRTLDADIAKITTLAMNKMGEKEIVVFAPISNDEIYPKGFSSTISVGELKNKLEGAVRNTHFDGVTTVVYRLFRIARATKAYFGQKDYQQVLIIKKMVADLEIPTEIDMMPIIRNAEGLALSSRNQYLNEQERTEALTLSKTLKNVQKLILTNQDYKSYVSELLEKDKRWDYLEVLDAQTLETNEKAEEFVVLGVLRLGTTRLLDNLLVTKGNK